MYGDGIGSRFNLGILRKRDIFFAFTKPATPMVPRDNFREKMLVLRLKDSVLRTLALNLTYRRKTCSHRPKFRGSEFCREPGLREGRTPRRCSAVSCTSRRRSRPSGRHAPAPSAPSRRPICHGSIWSISRRNFCRKQAIHVRY